MEIPLAHHALLTALPFVVPALTIVIGIGWIAIHDRLRDRHQARRYSSSAMNSSRRLRA